MKGTQVVALIGVLVLIAGVVVVKSTGSKKPAAASGVASGAARPTPAVPPPAAEKTQVVPTKEPAPSEAKAPAGKALPKMLELGSVGCKPCEYMAPIIGSLEKELAGKVFVKFYDVVKGDPAMAEKYQIMTIPTQIFLDSDGKELFRHVGVFEKEDILAKMKELKMLKG